MEIFFGWLLTLPVLIFVGFFAMGFIGAFLESDLFTWFRDLVKWFWSLQSSGSVLWVTTFFTYLVFLVSVSIAHIIEPEFPVSILVPFIGTFLWVFIGAFARNRDKN